MVQSQNDRLLAHTCDHLLYRIPRPVELRPSDSLGLAGLDQFLQCHLVLLKLIFYKYDTVLKMFVHLVEQGLLKLCLGFELSSRGKPLLGDRLYGGLREIALLLGLVGFETR